jgi:uncharacterized protein (DUF58 family)
VTADLRAQTLAAALPALLAEAEHLAASLMLGAHGRRRAGNGDEFWQYRPAMAGDAAGSIDWRRSARSDAHFVIEREWQAAQTVSLWVDPSQSMTYSGHSSRAAKGDRAQILALALAVLFLRGGERVGLIGGGMPRAGRSHLQTILAEMAADAAQDYGVPQADGFAASGRVVYLSDFLGPLEPLQKAMSQAADRGLRGIVLQILDPSEEDFPFQGRVIFESMAGSLRHETQSAADLRARYLDRLAERKAALKQMCQSMGWLYALHHSDQSAMIPLQWAYRALEGV